MDINTPITYKELIIGFFIALLLFFFYIWLKDKEIRLRRKERGY